MRREKIEKRKIEKRHKQMGKETKRHLQGIAKRGLMDFLPDHEV